MFVSHIKNIKKLPMNMEGAEKVLKQVLIGKNEGWDSHVMRLFTVEKNGHTPKHSHPYPHINFIISGKGILHMDGKNHDIEKGSIAYVPDNIIHQYTNTGEEPLILICIVPSIGEK
jgi:quercetin dioxygenase-like cupin family protein